MKVSYGVIWTSYGRQTMEVPDGLTMDEIVNYIEKESANLPLPSAEYVDGSDVLDYESIEVER